MSKASVAAGDCDDISHLTRIGKPLVWASKLDSTLLGRILIGKWTVVWLAPAVGAIPKVFEDPPDVIIIVLVLWQILAGFIVIGAKGHETLEKGAAEVVSLRDCLSWMHREIFSNDKDARITIMVPNRGRTELRVFLRPAGFPSTSQTKFACECNALRIEGVAAKSFCRSQPRPMIIDVQVIPGHADEEEQLLLYAAKSELPVEKVRRFSRKPRYYFAVPLGGALGNPIGVLIVDSLTARILPDSESSTSCTRTEYAVKVLATWVADRLARIPSRIIERAP